MNCKDMLASGLLVQRIHVHGNMGTSYSARARCASLDFEWLQGILHIPDDFGIFLRMLSCVGASQAVPEFPTRDLAKVGIPDA